MKHIIKTFFVYLFVLTYPVSGQDIPKVQVNLGHTGDITNMVLSANEEFVLTSSANLIYLRELTSLNVIRVFAAHTSSVTSLSFDLTGRYIISSSLDHYICIWDINSSKPIKKFKLHGDEQVIGACFSQDGKSIISIGNDGNFIESSSETGEKLRTFRSGMAAIQGFAVTNDLKKVSFSVWGKTSTSIYTYELSEKGAVRIHSKTYSKVKPSNQISGIRFTNDGSFLYYNFSTATQADYYSTVHFFNFKTKESGTYEKPYGYATLFLKDEGKLLNFGKTYDKYEINRPQHSFFEDSCNWPINGSLDISASHGKGDLLPSLTMKNNIISTKDQSILITSTDAAIHSWDRGDGEIKLTESKPQGDYLVDFENYMSSKYFVSIRGNGHITLWDKEQFKPILKTPSVNEGEYNVFDLFLYENSFGAVAGRTGRGNSIFTYTYNYETNNLIENKYVKDNLYDIGIWEKFLVGFRFFSTSLGKIKTKHLTFENIKSTVLDITAGRDFVILTEYNEGARLISRPYEAHNSYPYDQKKLYESAKTWGQKDDRYTGISSNQKYFFRGGFREINTYKTEPNSEYNSPLYTISLGTDKIAFPSVERATISNDGQVLVVHYDDAISLWDRQGNMIFKKDLDQGGTIAAAFLNEHQLLVAFQNKFFSVLDRTTGEEIFSFFELEDDNFLFIDPKGYYYTSKDIGENINYTLGTKLYNFDQFDLRYNRPDLVLAQIDSTQSDLIKAFRQAWEKRVKKMGFKVDDLEGEFNFEVPEISILNQIKGINRTTQPRYLLSYKASDSKHPLDRLFISVNGVPLNGVKGKKVLEQNRSELNEEVTIPLTMGKNVISVSVMNNIGTASFTEKIEVIYEPEKPLKPNLHLIAIGVSDFQQSEFNLTYANKDANDISQTFSNVLGTFDNVVVHTLTNEKATRENVLALRKELEQTKVDDEVIVFVASHGLLDEELDYYLAMHDTDFANPKNGGLRYDELEALIDGIPARNKAMFIDACHSGEVDKEESELVAANDVSTGTVKSRGFKRVTTKASNSGIGLKTSFELMKELFADLRRNNGAIVISSASGQEYAFESSEWQNGVFTYSLLEGLKSGNADLNKDGEIVVSEIRDYVSKRVQELTNGKQNPTSRTENLENDFRVW